MVIHDDFFGRKEGERMAVRLLSIVDDRGKKGDALTLSAMCMRGMALKGGVH